MHIYVFTSFKHISDVLLFCLVNKVKLIIGSIVWRIAPVFWLLRGGGDFEVFCPPGRHVA